MEWLWWFVTVALMIVGLLGTILPVLPGPLLIFAAAVLHRMLLGAAHSVTWAILVWLLVLTLLAHLLDFLGGTIGAKYFGATRWGALGGIIGGIVGLFFGLPGLFLGPIAGVLAGELLGGKGILPAGQSAWGTLVGTTAAIVGKLGIAVVMIGLFFAACAFRW